MGPEACNQKRIAIRNKDCVDNLYLKIKIQSANLRKCRIIYPERVFGLEFAYCKVDEESICKSLPPSLRKLTGMYDFSPRWTSACFKYLPRILEELDMWPLYIEEHQHIRDLPLHT